MAILWQSSLVPFIDPNGNPYVGAKAFFFDANTTTPKIVYTDSGFDVAHDHPVVANGAGMFPPIFIPSGDYRLRIEDASGATIWDVDGVSVPATGDDDGEPVDTPITLLARTGDIKARYATGAHSGWVRANARTIGNNSSGATERANDDTQDLFELLWAQDSNLVVSGGRGATATGDFEAGKTIQLPDLRGRSLFGLAGMGNSASDRIPSSLLTGDNTELGAFGGDAEITLTVAQMPSHDHTGTTNNTGNHNHNVEAGTETNNPAASGSGSVRAGSSTRTTTNNGAHTHSLNINNRGGGGAHSNLPPAMLVTFYLKL